MVSRTPEQIASSVKAIYDLPVKPVFSLAISGGGMQAIPMLFCVPGASACVMDASVPYSRAATGAYLADNFDQIQDSASCTKETALRLAKAACLKTGNLLLNGEGGNSPSSSETMATVSTIFGVSCTAALASAAPKKGSHRVHVGLYANSPTGGHGTTFSMILTKGLRDRLGEDAVCSRLILDVISQHVGLPLLPDSILIQNGLGKDICSEVEEAVNMVQHPGTDALENITSKKSKHALYFSKPAAASPTVSTSTGDSFLCLENATVPAGTLVYPGSFNPLHDGHLSLVRAQLDLLEQQFNTGHGDENNNLATGDATPGHFTKSVKTFRPPLVVFEIGAVNADKPPLPREEIMRRLAQFNPHTNPLFHKWNITNFAVSITSEPLFLGKATIFPGCDFLIGADTMVRLINPKYYADKTEPEHSSSSGGNNLSRRVANMVAALSTIAASKCHFVVGGRVKTVPVPAQTEAGTEKLTHTQEQVQTISVFETCDSILHSNYISLLNTSAVANEETDSSSSSSGGRVIDALPCSIVNLFVNLSEKQFRLDLSSTELRNKQAGSTPTTL